MKIKNYMLTLFCLAGVSSLPVPAFATVISVGSFESSLTGSLQNADPQGSISSGDNLKMQTYDTTGNLAFGTTPVVKDVLSSHNPFHDQSGITDGFYGNGSSWIGNSANSWLEINLGLVATIDQVIFGRDRLGFYSDRQAGRFKLEVALADHVFTEVVALTAVNYSNSQSVKTDFTAGIPELVTAQYLRLTFENNGTAIDEVEVFGTALISGGSVPAPAPLLLIGLTLAGIGFRQYQRTKAA